MEALSHFTQNVGTYNFPILMFLLQAFFALFVVVSIILFIYDRFIQRENQLLINYPLIGRMRYFFYALRDPMRQYFGDEKFYESFDKVKWVLNSAERKSPYASFSPEQPQKSARLSIKNANCVLNTTDVSDDFSVTFGEDAKKPFTTKSVFGRSAMSDGAISPEGTRAFSKGAFLGNFPINTGEGSLTSNFLYTYKYKKENSKYLETYEGTFFAKGIYKIMAFLFNEAGTEKVYRHLIIEADDAESYLFDKSSMVQGAKQTGGKLLASKVSEAIAYYRGVEAHKDLFSPNQFPFAHTLEELFDFMGRLKKLSDKPVGVKIVISSQEGFSEYAELIKKCLDAGSDAYPAFITIDGGDGGGGAAPLEMMMTVGMVIAKALYIADTTLRSVGVREKLKLIASEKVLTPDDAIVLFGIGADYIGIARAFMMSAGCIRARECSGANGRSCPVGLATQDKKKRASFLVEKKAKNVASYHGQLLYGIRNLLAIMGVNHISKLSKNNLLFKDHTGKTYMNVDHYFEESVVDLR